MRSRQTSPATKNHFVIALVVFLLAIFCWRFFPAPGERVSEFFFKPLLRGESSLYHLVTRDRDDAALTNTEIDYLKAENESLRALLGSDTEPRVGAGVIGRPTALPYDVLVIDKGSDDGIVASAPVYSAGDTVIGFVAKTHEKSAVIALNSTPGFTSTVYVFGPNIYTTAIGIGGGVTRIHVPQGIKLEVGDAVVIPSISSGIYGAIGAIDSVPESPEQYGYVTSAVPISSLKNVAVGTRPLSVIDFDTARAAIEGARRDMLMVDVPEAVLIDIGQASSTATSSEEGTGTSTDSSI